MREIKRANVAKAGRSFAEIMKADAGAADEIAKASGKAHRGRHTSHRSLAGALIEHLTDALDRKRERFGYQKAAAKDHTMNSHERWQDIVKSHGVDGLVEVAKNITEEQKSFGISEEDFVKLIDSAARAAYPALGVNAFETVYTRNPVLAKAIAVIKAGFAQAALDMTPTVISGGEWRDEGDSAEAMKQLAEIGRRMAPSATAAKQFELAFSDPKNVALANRAHRRPSATTYYPMPR